MDTIGFVLFLLISQFTIPQKDKNTVEGDFLASKSISLEERYDDKFVNDVLKDNILLSVSYLSEKVTKKEDINWDEIKKPLIYKFALAPKQTFAFHEDVLEKYKDSVAKTTNARFDFDDGFKSDGYLMGDGVCHLASLMYWVAKEAGLDAYAPTNHDFAIIPEIDKKYGVSIYKTPGQISLNAIQNLYVTNNKENPVVFEFSYQNGKLRFSISEVKKN